MSFRKTNFDSISLSIIIASLAAIIVFAVVSRDNYGQIREEREAMFADQAQKSLVSFQAQATHLFDYGDGLLRSVRHNYLGYGVSTLNDFVADVVAPRADRFQGTVTVTDGQGVPVFHSSGQVMSGTNLSGRDYFRFFHDHPIDQLYVGPTDYGAITHQWWFRLVRPVLRHDQLDGVVIMTMRPEHMVALYQNLSLGPRSTASMLTLQGHQLVARQPSPPISAYMKAMDDRSLWPLLEKQELGHYHTVDDIDGVARTYYFQRLDRYGVVIEVGFADQDVEDGLSLPRRNAVRQFVLFTLATLIFGGLLLAMRRKSLVLAERDVQLHELLERRGEKLADSEARFQGLVEQSLTGIYIIENGHFTYVNPAFCRIFGYAKADDILRLSPLDLVSPPDRLLVADVIRNHASGKSLEVRFAFRGIRQDDDPVYVEVHGNSIASPQSGHRIILGALLDVTETRRVEAEVRALNAELNHRVELGVAQQKATSARLTMVLETAAEGMIGLDDESRVIFLNRAAADLLGLASTEEVLGSQLSQILHHRLADGEACSHETCRIHRTLGDGQTRRVSDEYFTGTNGTMLPVEYAVSPLVVEGETVGAVVAFHDVSDRREAQEQIAHLLTFQRAILENTPVGIAIINHDRVIIQANPAFCRIYGREAEDIIGAHASVLYRDHVQCDDIGMRSYPLIASGHTFREEVQMRRGDGNDVWVNIEGHLVDAAHFEMGVVWAVTDITLRKTLDMELHRSNEELERFAYVASHDLRQPLRMISSYLSLLDRTMKGRLNEEELQFFGFAIDGAKRMDRMIVDLLDYSRIGRAATERGRVSLTEVLEHVRFNLGGAIAEVQGQLIVADNLPDVDGYESELERLFLNLIGNALKFRVEGRSPQVTVSCEEKPEGWVLSVADNGIGIAAEHHQRLFQIFQRLVTREQYEGTGIGLASCRKIVEHHGGRIWVESTLGEGSRFFVLLPN